MNVWLIAAMSADGKIAESSHQSSMDWTSKEDTRFFIDKTKEAGVMIMGRKTFETIGKPLKGRRIIVMTRNNEPLEGMGEGLVTGLVEYTTHQPVELLQHLASEGVETVVVAGGGAVYSRFLQEGLVTDLYLTIEPVLFGDGVSFVSDINRITMRLEEVIQLNDQSVLIHYKV